MEVVSANQTRSIGVEVNADVGEARRTAAAVGNQHGLSVGKQEDARIVVSELGQNIVKHAGHGLLLITQIVQGEHHGIELMSVDKGPGIADVRRSLEDGFSSAGTAGHGLGAVSRIADQIDFYSPRGGGTVVLARLWNKGWLPPPKDHLQVFGVSAATGSEMFCGDSWAWKRRAGSWHIMVADGLGHGEAAADASSLAVKLFHESTGEPKSWFAESHRALRRMRGVAAAWAQVDPSSQKVTFWGVGNISASIFDYGSVKRLVSRYGTIGVTTCEPHPMIEQFSPNAVLVMHSDGIQTRWDIDDYPGLLNQDASIIAGVLFRDFRRTADDATIVVIKKSPQK